MFFKGRIFSISLFYLRIVCGIGLRLNLVIIELHKIGLYLDPFIFYSFSFFFGEDLSLGIIVLHDWHRQKRGIYVVLSGLFRKQGSRINFF